MQFMSSWATSDNRTLLHFSPSTIRTFHHFKQNGHLDKEAGGLILGSVHGSHMLVERVTVPTAWDKRFRNLFERLPFGHKVIALSRWVESHGTVRYLGEWHTHPEDHPHPSGIDISEWKRLAALRVDQRPMLGVIVGRKSLHIELVSRSGIRFSMQSVEEV